MSNRSTHKFEFSAQDIARAAAAEAQYHEERHAHWQARADKALSTVEKTIGAKVVRLQQTNGERVSVVVDYGDKEAWREYEVADQKAHLHRQQAERYRTDERVYGTQNGRHYDLDTEDVHHFRLGGQDRED